MIVYFDRKERLAPASLLSRAQSEGPEALLIALGEVEAANLDAGCSHEATAKLSQAMLAAARNYLGLDARGVDLGVLLPVNPRWLDISPHEGLTFYGLPLLGYADAARRFFREERPTSVVVAGIRGIGTTLSAVVAAVLDELGCAVQRVTVRPEGHPFDRRVKWPEVSLSGVDWVAIVDEGPGISGTSFAATVESAIEQGWSRDRIAVFPSWDPSADQLQSSRARTLWPTLRRYSEPFLPSRDAPSLERTPIDIGAGLWRTRWMAEADWPAAHPQHERRKWISRDGRTIARYAGLGLHGVEGRRLAMDLDDSSLGPSVSSLQHGFLFSSFVDGRPLRADQLTMEDCKAVGRYIAIRSRMPPCSSAATFDQLAALIDHNCREAGLQPPDTSAFRDVVADSPRCAIDGRMMPHEWIRTRQGLKKTDAVDHCRDHFYPGCTDPAWDLAGVEAELDLDEGASGFLLQCYGQETGDSCAARRLPFFRTAYLAFRLGYAAMAARSTALDASESGRFRQLENRYRARLHRQLAKERGDVAGGLPRPGRGAQRDGEVAGGPSSGSPAPGCG